MNRPDPPHLEDAETAAAARRVFDAAGYTAEQIQARLGTEAQSLAQTPDRPVATGPQGAGSGTRRSQTRAASSTAATSAAIQSGPAGPMVADGSMEQHTFKLEDGTIHGIGSTIAGESIFSIAGGTGRYAGSRGHYVAQHGCASSAATEPPSSPST